MPADTEEVAPGVGHGPSQSFTIRKQVRDCFTGHRGESLSAGRLKDIPFSSRAEGAYQGQDIAVPGNHPAPETGFAAQPERCRLAVHFQHEAAGFLLHAGHFAVDKQDVPRSVGDREGQIPFRVPDNLVFLAPFRRKATDIIDIFSVFGQSAAGRTGRVRTAHDGTGLASEHDPSVNPVGESVPVPVLPEGVDSVLPDQESPDRLPAFEPEQFRPVAGENGFRLRRIIGIQMSAPVAMHIRMDAGPGRNAPDQPAVPVQVDPDLAFDGAGVQVPGISVREADGGKIDVFSGGNDVPAGGSIRPLASGGRFMGTSGGAGKQRVPDAGRRKEGEADDDDGFAHISFFRPR